MRLGVIDFSEKHANIGTLFWATVYIYPTYKHLSRLCPSKTAAEVSFSFHLVFTSI